MLDLEPYVKKANAEIDTEFQEKKKFGDVYAARHTLFVKKGFKWFMVSLNKVSKAQIISGSRQLRQCCGAPIYTTKILFLTTESNENLYLNVEDIEHIDMKKSEALLQYLKQNNQMIEIM